MKLLHWNCQGLRNPLTIPFLTDIRKSSKPDVMFLIETKNNYNYVANLGKELGYHSHFVIPANDLSGGLPIFWSTDVQIDFVRAPSLNYTDLTISWDNKFFCLTYVYGPPVKKIRNNLWRRMIFLAEAGYYRRKPRLVLGDLNDIKSNGEKEGGPLRSESTFALFRKMLNVSGLHDLKMIGGKFTWKGRRWRHNEDIKKAIQQTWTSQCQNIPSTRFSDSLKYCRSSLSKWKQEHPNNTSKLIYELKEALHKEPPEAMDLVLKHIQPCVTPEMNLNLLRPVTLEEVHHVLKQMNRNKSPGPDGFNAGFFQDHWNVIHTAIMKKMGFSDRWCSWIMTCISTVTYSVLINGSPHGRIHPSRGKEVMLKSVAQAVPTYSMSCFLLPTKTLHSMTSSMRRFWWSASPDAFKIPWIAWKKINRSKASGGIGIRDLKHFNLAMLAKQSWRLLQHPQSLMARVYKAKYFPKTRLLEAPVKKTSSYAWRSIQQGTNQWNEVLLQSLMDPEDAKLVKLLRPSLTDNLKMRKMLMDNRCYLCGEDSETVNHLLFQCRISKEIWSLLPDASWCSPNEQAGIGWILYDDRGAPILKGSSSIAPTINSLEAEAEALRMAVLEIKKLRFTKVLFCGDSANLFRILTASRHSSFPPDWTFSLISSYLHDILKLNTPTDGFRFMKIPKKL